jgi:hypothetical protein
MHSALTRASRVKLGSVVSSAAASKAASRRRRHSVVSKAAGSGVAPHALFEPLENRTMLSTTYYVSPSGSDSNSGTSTSSPFKDISKVNSLSLSAGDNVLFQGGQTFDGSVLIRGGGSSSSYVTFGSYGSGKATIKSGGVDGFEDYNASGVMVQNLNFVGSPNGLNQDGVKFEANSGGLSNIAVENCSITGYYYAGILVQGDNGNGFSNIQFTQNTIYNNVDSGIDLDSTNNSVGSHHNVYIAYNNVYGNYGSTDSSATGNGMELGSMNNATVQDNVATDNGADGIGGCGIWAYDSTGVTFQYNVSGNNRTAHGTDGDGFDFDSNTSNSVMQYNYAYDNDGNGLQLNQWQNNSESSNDIIRYNISQDNGQNNSYADFEVWGDIQNSSIYGNTGYVAPATRGGSPYGIKVHNATIGNLFVNNVTFANNIIVTSGGVPAVDVPAAELSGAKNLKFEGNDYWAASGSLNIEYGSSTYSSVSSWESATGQEKLSGKAVGLQVNPGLVAAGQGAALTSASQLSSLTAYKLTSSSPLVTAGVSLSAVGLSVPSEDFFGDPVSASYAFSMGADQATTKSASASTSGTVSSAATTATTTTTTTTTTAPTTTTTSTTKTAGPSSSWTSSDIGSVGAAGTSSYANGIYTVGGSGADITGSSDAFQYDYTTETGDTTVVAEVTSLTYANVNAKVGIMLRDGTAADAKEVSIFIAPNGIAHFDARTSVDASTSYATALGTAKNEWVKLVRSGTTITGYISSDDATWVEVGSATASMSSTLDAGLAVTAHDAGALETATFANVSV